MPAAPRQQLHDQVLRPRLEPEGKELQEALAATRDALAHRPSM